jgi:hypothetical protein
MVLEQEFELQQQVVEVAAVRLAAYIFMLNCL